jgi:glycosyltransferase involved in cell wall biosynthesis
VETAVGLQSNHGFHCLAACLREEGRLGEELKARGVSLKSRLASRRFDPVGFVRLVRFLRATNPGVLYMLDHRNAVLYGVPAAVAAGVRYRIMAVHTMGLLGGKKSVPTSVRLLLPWISAIVTVAKQQQQYLEEVEGIPREKMAHIPNGVDVGRFRPPADEVERNEARRFLGVPSDNMVVGTLSVLRPEKGHEVFLEAAASISKQMDNVSFVVMGDGPEREKLEAMAKGLGMNSHVVFTGWVSDTETALRALDVAVMSSRPVVETAPLAALEAMATGVPMVVSDVGALRELVNEGSTGFLVRSGDSAALAERLVELLADEAMRRMMSREARKTVKEAFQIQDSVAASAALLRRLTVGGGARA